jgi:Glycosyl hydrolase family 26
MRTVLGVLLVAAVVAAPVGASPGGTTARVELGITGDPARFTQLTGQRSTIRHNFVGWHQGNALPQILGNLGPTPMIAVKTGGGITPAAIATGRGDAFLLQLNKAVSDFGGRVYVRPLPEMNGHWNDYCAFNRDGSSRGSQFSTAVFRKAFARIAIVARGGPKVNLRLGKLGLPGIGRVLLPETKARIVWNPQGYGAPDIPKNSAQAYYPGDAYVDVVANDLYDQGFNAAWDANEALYKAHKSKAYALAEWGLWGIDDPAFVEKMAAFVKTHPRVEFLAYFNSKPGAIWDLGNKPRSRAAYRRLITPLGR